MKDTLTISRIRPGQAMMSIHKSIDFMRRCPICQHMIDEAQKEALKEEGKDKND